MATVRSVRRFGRISRKSMIVAAVASAVAAFSAAQVQAATIYWDGVNASWNTAANWSTDPTNATPNPGSVPGASDDVIFNRSGNNGTNIAVTLDAAQAAQSLTFSNTGTSGISSGTGGTASTLTLGSGGITVNSGAGAVTINAPIILNATQSWTNNATNTNNSFTAAGNVNLGANNLTITGSAAGTTQISGIISGTGSLTINLSGTGNFVLGSSASTYSGGTYLNGGILALGGIGSTPSTLNAVVTSGAFGTGTIYFNGGSLRKNGNNISTIANTIQFTGGTSSIFGSGYSSTGTFTFNGAATVTTSSSLRMYQIGTAVLSVAFNSALNFADGVNFTIADAGILGANAGASFGTAATANAGINLQSTNTTGTLSAPYNAGAFTNNSTATMTLQGIFSAGAANQSLTLAGSGPITVGNLGSSANNPRLIVNGTGTYTFNSAAGTYAGGTDLIGVTTVVANSSTVSGGVITGGPFGTGYVNISGGTFRADGTARTLHNDLTIGGTITFGAVSGSNSLTFDPTTRTIPGTITVSGTTALTLYNGLTLNGPITGTSTPSVSVKGPGTLTLINATTNAISSFGGMTIGDSSPTGSLGGTVTAGTANGDQRNALGSGAYTVNFGGYLNSSFHNTGSYANAVTVNNGGRSHVRGNLPTGAWIVNSGATLEGNGAGGSSLANTSSLSLPTAGVLNFIGAGVALKSTYPSLSGTMVFGGSSAGTLGSLTLSDTTGSDRTIGFTSLGNGSTFTGVALNANLTVAGGGATGLTGVVASASSSVASLGAITTSSGTRNIIIAMAPTGVVGATTITGWNNTTLSGGVLQITTGTTTISSLGTGTVTLDGGALRLVQTSNGITALNNNITVNSTGGALEFSYSNAGNTQTLNYGGALSGSGAVTLRTLPAIGGTTGFFRVSGSNIAFDGGFTIASTGNLGTFLFDSIAALGSNGTGTGGNTSTKNNINATAGTPFGFGGTINTTALLATAMTYFTTNSDSILALTNFTSTNINLSNTGTNPLNRNIRLGNGVGALTYTGTITPFASTYNITPTQGSTLSIGLSGTNSIFTGANNLDVRAGAVSPGATAVQTGTLAITAVQNYTGTTTVAGTVLNGLMGSGVTGVTVSTNSGLINTSAITVDQGATFTVTGSAGGTTGASGVGIVIKGNGVLSLTTADNTLTSSGTLTLGGDTGGGSVAMQVSRSYSLSSLTVGAGSSTLGSTTSGVINFTGLAATAYTRQVGGYINFNVAANGSFSNAPSGTTSVIGGILVGATFGSAAPLDLVAAGTGTLVAPVYTAQSTASSWGAGQNITNTNSTSGFTGTTGAGLSINSLRNFGSASGTVAIGTGTSDTLTLASGMLLSGASTGMTINGPGQLLVGSAVADYQFINSSAATITVAAQLGSAKALTKAGSGILTLSNTSNAITDIYAIGGNIDLTAAALGSSGAIYALGGSVRVTSGTVTLSKNATIGPTGGSVRVSGGTLIMNGSMTMNGWSSLHPGNGDGNGTITYNGTISGPGGFFFGAGGSSGGRLSVTIGGANTNSGWSGGIATSSTGGGSGFAQLRIGDGTNATGMGTGPLSFASKTMNIYFDTGTTNATYANDIVLSSGPVSFWGLGTGLSTGGSSGGVTLSGRIVSTSGLVLQGHATGDNAISEIVLSGTLSTSGAPNTYSFGTTTFAQNFVNANGGITLGVTDMSGLTQTTNSAANKVDTAGNFNVTGAGTIVQNGALGFVRFNGTNSFIPGQVGPGFLSAIRKAGTGNEARFGYLLTAGSTYSLPEGKSFVIGSLGTGASVGGTLGASGSGTATLVSSNKLNGFGGGDVNIHANAVGDNQTLTLLTRESGTNLVLGGAAPVIFTPTYGDSGATSAVTLLSTRTGGTTLNKTGAGTLTVSNTDYRTVGGAAGSARSGFTWNLNAGTTNYAQTDISGTANTYAGFNVNSTATLKGTGTINANVVVNNGGRWAPGTSPGVQNAVASTWNSSGNYDWEVYDASIGSAGTSSWDAINLSGALTINATSGSKFNINILSMNTTSTYGNAINFSNSNNYAWRILDTASAIGSSAADATSRLNLDASGFSNSVGSGTWAIQRGDNVSGTYANGTFTGDSTELWIVFNGAVTTATTYNLAASATSTNLLVGGKTGIGVNITNAGSGMNDTLNYSGLAGSVSGAGSVAGAAVSGGPLGLGVTTPSGTNNSFSGTLTGTGYGTANLSGTATGTNATIGGAATLGTNPTVAVTVGNATTNGTTFGTALTADVSASDSLAGLASRTRDTVDNFSSTSNGFGTDGTESGAMVYGTVAKILSGTASTSSTVTMDWRAGSASLDLAPLFSDVVRVQNINITGVWVLAMTYDETLAGANENALFLGLRNIDGTYGNAGGLGSKIFDSWSATYLTSGQWGIDTTNNYVWAVLNNNGGTFAVIPEPTSLALLGLGAVGLLARRRRK